MNNPQQIADTIRLQLTMQKLTLSKMLSDIELGKSAISHMDNGSMIKADSLGKIADYLGVSVDYLLGRTPNPELQKSPNVVNFSNNGNNNTNTVAVNAEILDKDTLELARMIKELPLVQRSEIVVMIDKMKSKKYNIISDEE